jgi:hypothetical protein
MGKNHRISLQPPTPCCGKNKINLQLPRFLHVNPQIAGTQIQTTTSSCPMSYPPSAILDIEQKFSFADRGESKQRKQIRLLVSYTF